MPWHIDKNNCVRKSDDNSLVHCHNSRAEAEQHLAALYANEPQYKAGELSAALAWETTGIVWTNAIGLPITELAPAEKANYSARAGQTIAGRLVRGADGKFSSGGSATERESQRILEESRQRQERQGTAPKKGSSRRGSSRRSATGRRPSTRTAAPKKTDEQRRQEAEQRRAESRERRTAEQEARRTANLAKVQQALAEKMSAAEFDALLAFNDGEPADEEQLGELLRTGLVERDPQGQLRMTEAGRAFATAAERGDTRDTQDALSRGQERVLDAANDEIADRQRDEARAAREAETEARRQQREREREERRGGGGGGSKPPEFSPELAAAASKLSTGQKLTRAERRSLITNGLARRSDGRLVLTAAGLRAARQEAQKSFTAFKGADGRWRWVLSSSTTFQDRDREFVSLKAMEGDVARSDATGDYGPLRWWHVPGLDIGDCDWRCVVGRTLVESGTFRDERIGAAVARKAADLQASLGFLYGPQDRDAQGVFWRIHTYERSLVPHGRASNPFTRLVVKEVSMLTDQKKAQLKELLGDDALLERLLTQVQQTEKEADARGVAHKEAGLAAALAGAGLKVEDPNEAPVAVEAEAKAKADAPAVEVAVEEPAEEAGELLVGDMTPAEFTALLSNTIQQGNAPLLEALNGLGLADKMRGVMDEFKSTLGAYTAKKDSETAETAEALRQSLKEAQDAAQAAQQQATEAAQRAQQLDTRLKELEGDQPAGQRGYRPSADPRTVITDGHRLKEGQPEADPLAVHERGAMAAIAAATGAQPFRG